MLSWTFLLAVVPFVVFLYLLLGYKTTILKSSLVGLVLITLVGIGYWQINGEILAKSYGKGFLIAFDIFFIILGAIFFLEIMRRLKIIDNISYYLESFSGDYRIQIVLLAWFMENFLEGTAGFGTPSTVVAPLLIALGLSPFMAVVIGLLGNSTSVVFGAAGTPIRVGFASLETSQVPYYASLINIVGLIIPAVMLWAITRTRINGNQEFKEALPFAIWSGIAFVIPSFMVVGLGQEFPSILGSVIGLFIILITLRWGFLVPKTKLKLSSTKLPHPTMPWWQAAIPYLLLIFFLIGGKFLLVDVTTNIPWINYNFNWYNPGFAFILTGVITLAMFGHRQINKIFYPAAGKSLHSSVEPFLVIIAMSTIAQIMITSGTNTSGLPSITNTIAMILENTFLPLLSSLIGAFGSFLTGSATISNIMFGSLLDNASKVMDMNTAKILALALVGGAAGNMIALADMLAAETVAGLKNKENQLIRVLIYPCLAYALLAGLIGVLII